MTNTIQTYPTRIEDAALAIHQARVLLNEKRSLLETLNDELLKRVLTAVDSITQKPLYTNEQMRALALRERQGESEEWYTANALVIAAEEEHAEAVARLERLRNEFRLGLLAIEQEMHAARVAGEVAAAHLLSR